MEIYELVKSNKCDTCGNQAEGAIYKEKDIEQGIFTNIRYMCNDLKCCSYTSSSSLPLYNKIDSCFLCGIKIPQREILSNTLILCENENCPINYALDKHNELNNG